MERPRIVRFDWAMNHLLRNKANYDIVEGFLCALLRDDSLRVLELLESESNAEDKEDKFNRTDVVVKDHQGRKILIEIQNTKESDYLFRILYGASKKIAGSINSGDNYHKIDKIISVSILYFNLGIGEDYLYYGSTEFVGMNTRERITSLSPQAQKLLPTGGQYNGIEIYPEYYLIQVEKYQDKVNQAIDEWVYWFKHERIKEGSQSKHIDKVQEKLDYLHMSRSQRKAYDAYMEWLASERDMVETAREEGREEVMEELAEARQRENEARQRMESERREKEEAQQREAAERRQKEEAQTEKLIWKLHSKGKSESEIAKETGTTADYVRKVLTT